MRYTGVTRKVVYYELENGEDVAFDSKLEFSVYLKLRNQYFLSARQIKIHYPLVISVENEYFSTQKWKIDFLVTKKGRIKRLIEAKGVFDANFKSKLMLLSVHRPDLLSKLTIVTYKSIKIPRWAKKLNIVSLSDF